MQLDVVVLFTDERSTDAALCATCAMASDLGALVRLIRIEEVPYPLPLESPRVSAEFLEKSTVPLAEKYGAHVVLCFARNTLDGVLHLLSPESVVVLAASRRSCALGKALESRGYSVVIENVSESRK